jgi:3-dehydroquinate synthase
MTVIDFPGAKSYPVTIGHNLLADISKHIDNYDRIAIFSAQPLLPVARELQSRITETSKCFIRSLPDGEEVKSIKTISDCWEFLAESKISRTDLVVGIGGGAVTDAVNFLAATWLRGIDVVLIPTTVLAMVDAAIGGKSGINTESGKNLVGVFNDPKAVFCDLELLTTLNLVDIKAGFAEIIKCGFIADMEILDIVQVHSNSILDTNSPEFMLCLQKAIAVKAQVVETDRTEQASSGVGRAALNYGHTLGHAIEKNSGYRWRHGEAVSIGMIFAAELALELGMLDSAAVQLHHDILTNFGLPTTYGAAKFEELAPIMALDKKVQSGNLRFVLLRGLGKPEFVINPTMDSLITAFNRLDPK